MAAVTRMVLHKLFRTENVVAASLIHPYSARSPHQVRGKVNAACAVFFAAQIDCSGGFWFRNNAND